LKILAIVPSLAPSNILKSPVEKRVHVFVLTAEEEDGRRRRNAVAQLEALRLPYEFVEGPDASANSAWDEYSPFMNRLLQRRSLSRGEVACYLGHRRIWALEDDFEIVDDEALQHALHDCVRNAAAWDMIKLFDFSSVHRAGLRFPELPYRHLIETEGFGLMACDAGVTPIGLPNVAIYHSRS